MSTTTTTACRDRYTRVFRKPQHVSTHDFEVATNTVCREGYARVYRMPPRIEGVDYNDGHGHEFEAGVPHAFDRDDQKLVAGPHGQFVNGLTWTSGTTLKIAFQSGHTFTASSLSYTARKAYVRSVVQQLQIDTSLGLGFHFLQDSQFSQAHIRISFNSSDGAWSQLGTNANLESSGTATMNLGWLDSPEESNGAFTGTGAVVLHEFGHALALYHEHQTDQVPFAWNESVVTAALSGPPNNWSTATIEHNVFSRLDTGTDVGEVQQSEYDSESIMHYYFPSTWTIPQTTMSINVSLSTQDIAELKSQYPVAFQPSPPFINDDVETTVGGGGGGSGGGSGGATANIKNGIARQFNTIDNENITVFFWIMFASLATIVGVWLIYKSRETRTGVHPTPAIHTPVQQPQTQPQAVTVN